MISSSEHSNSPSNTPFQTNKHIQTKDLPNKAPEKPPKKPLPTPNPRHQAPSNPTKPSKTPFLIHRCTPINTDNLDSTHRCVSVCIGGSFIHRFLDDGDFFLGQVVKPIDERVDLRVRRRDQHATLHRGAMKSHPTFGVLIFALRVCRKTRSQKCCHQSDCMSYRHLYAPSLAPVTLPRDYHVFHQESSSAISPCGTSYRRPISHRTHQLLFPFSQHCLSPFQA